MPIKLTFPDDRKPDKAFAAWAEKMLSDAGVTQVQADYIATSWQAHTDEWMQADASRTAAAREQEVAALRSQWGSQLDTHIAAGRRAAASLGLDPKALAALDNTIGIGATMSLLARIGSKVATDPGTGKSSIAIENPEAAKAEIARLSGDRQFQDTLRDTKNPTARAEALAKWEGLWAQAYPQPEAPAASAAALARDLGLSAGTVDALEKAAKDASGKREAAQLRIDQLKGDAAFQDRMRDVRNPGREAAVQEWNEAHRQAHEGAAQ